jgi:hypothetical protein
MEVMPPSSYTRGLSGRRSKRLRRDYQSLKRRRMLSYNKY